MAQDCKWNTLYQASLSTCLESCCVIFAPDKASENLRASVHSAATQTHDVLSLCSSLQSNCRQEKREDLHICQLTDSFVFAPTPPSYLQQDWERFQSNMLLPLMIVLFTVFRVALVAFEM